MCSNSLQALRVQTISADADCSKCNELQHTLATAKETLREFQLLDEEVQPSKNDELACQQVEPFVRVVQGRYEMPVSFKANVLKALPNNYNDALKRTLSVRQTAFKNNELKCTLTDTFAELLESGWIGLLVGMVGLLELREHLTEPSRCGDSRKKCQTAWFACLVA